MKAIYFIILFDFFSCNKQKLLYQKEIFSQATVVKIDSLSKAYIEYVDKETNLPNDKYYDKNFIIIDMGVNKKICESCLLLKFSTGNKIDISEDIPNYIKIYKVGKHKYAFLYFSKNGENLEYVKRALVDSNLIDKNDRDDSRRKLYSLVEENENWYSCINKKGNVLTIKSPYIVKDSQLREQFCQ